MLNHIHTQLILKNLQLKVKLGYSEEERSLSQWVSVQIKLCFANIPKACHNDTLQDTLCYDSLSNELQNFCDNHSFKLIEAMGYQLYQFLREKITAISTEKTNISLCITKKPPLPHLEKASFLISD